MGICAHPSIPLRRKRSKLWDQRATVVEQLLGLVALHPFFEEPKMIGLGSQLGQRHLMRAPCIFNGLAVNNLRAGPALGCSKNDHGPDRAIRVSLASRLMLNGMNLG